ncbi:MAG: hypothetical protein KDD53_04685, partial [Bdellovibrionales bacterium]|nr:hypothetical protein [Bdellovibrionales bacterium]
MITVEELSRIFGAITEEFEEAVPIGGRCESFVYYRVEDLSEDDLNACAEYVAERILRVCSPHYPELILKLPGGYSFFAERLAAVFSEINPSGKEVPLEQFL